MSPTVKQLKQKEEASTLVDRIDRITGIKFCKLTRSDEFGNFVLTATLDLPVSNGFCVPPKDFSLRKLTDKVRSILEGYKACVHPPKRTYMGFMSGKTRLIGYPSFGMFQIDLSV